MRIILLTAVRIIFPPTAMFSPLILKHNLASLLKAAKSKVASTFAGEAQSEKHQVKKILKKIYRNLNLDFDSPNDGAIFANFCFGKVQLV